MTTTELDPPACAPEAVPDRVEQACSALGLTLTLRDTLSRYPGCIHWHYKQGSTPGVLELTWWPRKHRLWAKVAGNRAGAWTAPTTAQIQTRLRGA